MRSVRRTQRTHGSDGPNHNGPDRGPNHGSDGGATRCSPEQRRVWNGRFGCPNHARTLTAYVAGLPVRARFPGIHVVYTGYVTPAPRPRRIQLGAGECTPIAA